MPINDSREAPILRQGPESLVGEEVVSLADTPAGRWSWSGNRVTLTTGKDPSREGHSISFYAVPLLKRTIRKRLALDRSESLP